MRRVVLAAACGLLCLPAAAPAQTSLGTSFTYQGRLTDAGNPPSGPYDMRFILFDAPVGGNQVGPMVFRDDVAVSAGLFTVTLDFGAVFGGQRRFLEVGVRPGPGGGVYSALPRHEVTAAPAALFGATAPWTGLTGKPAGFADDVDNDTTYGALINGGIQLSGNQFFIPTAGVSSSMIQDNAVGSGDIA